MFLFECFAIGKIQDFAKSQQNRPQRHMISGTVPEGAGQMTPKITPVRIRG